MATMRYECDYEKYLESIIGHFVGNRITYKHVWHNCANNMFVRYELTVSRFGSYQYDQLATAVAKVGIELVGFDFFGNLSQLELTFKVVGNG